MVPPAGPRPRRGIVEAYTLLAVGYCAVSAWLFYVVVGSALLGIVHLVALGAVVGNYLVLQGMGNKPWATHGLVGAVVLVSATLFATGGWKATGHLWTYAFLPYVFVLLPRRAAGAWSLGLAGLEALMVALHWGGVIQLPYRNVVAGTFLATVGVTLVCVYLFQRDWHLTSIEKLQAETHRHETETRVELESVKARFLTAAAHELSVPLTPMQLQVHVLRSSAPERTVGQLSKTIEILERNTQVMAALVQDLLAGASLQANQFALMRQDVDVSAIARSSVAAQQLGAGNRGVALELDAPLPLWTKGDAARLAQVMDNLLAQAVKTTPSGGTVRVRAHRRDTGIGVEVEDTGSGLDAAQKARLLQPFGEKPKDATRAAPPGSAAPGGQAPPTTQAAPASDATASAGLGLYICKGIVEAHGADLEVESAGPGKGTKMSFILPGIQEAIRAEEAEVDGLKPRTARRRRDSVRPPREKPAAREAAAVPRKE